MLAPTRTRKNGVFQLAGNCWLPNSAIGLGDGSSASTSGWYTMTVVLTDNGTGFDATASVAYNGSDVWASAGPIATPYASGALLFGGYTTGNNTDTGLDPDISPKSVGDLGKLSNAMVDNFSLESTAVPEPGSLALLSLGLISVLARRRA